MRDPRIPQLARNLITHSVKLQAGEKILIDLYDTPSEMGIALSRPRAMPGASPS